MAGRGYAVAQDHPKQPAANNAWREVTLGDVVRLHTEQLTPAHRAGTLFRHFSIPAFDQSHTPANELGGDIGSNKFTVPTDSILVSRLNPRIPRVWEPTIEEDDVAIASTEFLVLLPRAIDRRFLKFLCLGPKMRSQLEGMATGTSGSHQRVRREDVLNIRIPLPPLPEQRAIAHILGTLDDKIELNRRMNETLEEMARALFKSWFVDFEPVRAKMDGRWRPGQSLPGLPADHYHLFPDRLVDSELGEIPEGWEVKALGEELSELVSGARPRGGAVEGGLPSIGAENVNGLGQHDYAKEKYIPAEFMQRLKAKGAQIQDADVLLYKDGAHVGRKTYVDCGYPHSVCAVNEHVFILRLRHKEAQRYLFFWLDQDWMTYEITTLNSNSAQPGINRVGVRSLPILVPAAGVLREFNQQTGHLTDRLFANCHESRVLAEMRDALLPKLVSGEVRV